MQETLECYIRVTVLIIGQLINLSVNGILALQLYILHSLVWVVQLRWLLYIIASVSRLLEYTLELCTGLKIRRTTRKAVVLFTRYPQIGRCKPQLIPYIGAHNAAFLQRITTENLVRAMQPLHSDDKIELFAAYKEHTCNSRARCDCQHRMAFWFERLHAHQVYRDARLLVPSQEDPSVDEDGLRHADSFRTILPQLLSRIQYESPEEYSNGNNFHSGVLRGSCANGHQNYNYARTMEPEDRSRCSSNKPEPCGFTFFRQRGPDVASAIHHAFDALFRRRFDQVVIVSSEVPGIDAAIIRQALSAMDAGADIILGKTNSGGVYLVGYKSATTRSWLSEMLLDSVWNTRTVYAGQVERATRYGFSCATLRTRLDDVDHLQDMAVVERYYGVPGRMLAQESISVVIPCLNEGAAIEMTLTNLVRNFSHRCPMQVLVVDGGSADDTLRSLHNFKRNLFRYGSEGVELELLTLPPDRRNFRSNSELYGLERARGSYMLILHADTYLPKHWDRYLLGTLARPGVVAGSFTFQVRVPNEMVGRKELVWALRVFLLEMARNWRARRFELPYGDQGLFFHAYYYRQLGGLRAWPFFEDIEIVRRAWRFGHVAVSSAPALTSPRRWFRVGYLRASLLSSLVLLAFRLGVPAEQLGEVYHHLNRGYGETREPIT